MQIEQREKNTLHYIMGLTMFCYCLGETINFYGVNLSWIVSIIFAVIVVICVAVNPQAYSIPKKKQSWVIFFLALGLYSFLMVLFRKGGGLAVQNNRDLLINLCIIVVALVLVKTKKQLLICIYFTLLGILVNALAGAYQIIFSASHYFDPSVPMGAFGNPNDFATLMIFGILLIMVVQAINGKKKAADFVFIIFFAILVYFSTSRSALLAVIIILPVYIFNNLLSKKTLKGNFKKERSYYWIIVLAIFCVFALLIYTDLYANIMKFLGAFNSAEIGSDEYRFSILRQSIDIFLRSGLLGMGAKGGESIIGINQHSFFAEILTDYGILFFVGFLLFFRRVCTHQDNSCKKIGAYLKTIVFIFFVISFASSSIFRLRPTSLLLVILLLVTLIQQKGEKIGRK